MGRDAERERARIVRKISEYLDRAEADSGLGLSYDSIQQATGVSRGHLSRRTDEPEIAALVTRIGKIKTSRVPAADTNATTVAEPVSNATKSLAVLPAQMAQHAALSDEGLARLIQRELRELARLQEQWVTRHARDNAHDAPLALYDADALMPRLRAAIERVRPLVSEWNRRRGITIRGEASSEEALTLL